MDFIELQQETRDIVQSLSDDKLGKLDINLLAAFISKLILNKVLIPSLVLLYTAERYKWLVGGSNLAKAQIYGYFVMDLLLEYPY